MNNIKLITIAGKTLTTSRQIAETFGKRHTDVLKKIKTLNCSEDFNQRNFSSVEYKDSKGELRKEFQITRDGFTILAMGFTGKKAMEFKEAYINAFNAMEKKQQTNTEEFYLIHKSVMDDTGEALLRFNELSCDGVSATPYRNGKVGLDQIGQLPPPPNSPNTPRTMSYGGGDSTYLLQVLQDGQLDSHVIPASSMLIDSEAVTDHYTKHRLDSLYANKA